MRDGEDAVTLFRLINGLAPGEMPRPGEKVKIITES
jgi:predicted Zn-dependent protease